MPMLKGFKHSEDTKRKMSKSSIGKHLGEKNGRWKGGKPYCLDCRKKLSRWHVKRCIKCANKLFVGKKRPELVRKKISIGILKLGDKHPMKQPEIIAKIQGKNNWNWKGGITPENQKIRKSIEYDIWQHAVFTRDNYTCQKTGIRGGRLVAHHILNFAEYHELRLDINNGITLSKKAHHEFHHKYGIKHNTREQLEEFLKNDIT